MLNLSPLIKFGWWLLRTGLWWAIGILLIAPLVTSLSNRRRRFDLIEPRSRASDLLLSEWANVVNPTVDATVSMMLADQVILRGHTYREAHENLGSAMKRKDASVTVVNLICDGLSRDFTAYTNHLRDAENAYRRCEISGESFLQRTAILTSIVDPEELTPLLVIRRQVSGTIRCAQSMISAIQEARGCRSVEVVKICDYRLLNRRIKSFSAMLLSKPPTDKWIVRLADNFFVQKRRISDIVDDVFLGTEMIELRRARESGAVSKPIPPKTFDEIEEALPSVEKQEERAEVFLDHPPFSSWIADFRRWGEELRETQEPEPKDGMT